MDLESNPSNEVSHVRNEVIMFKSSTVLDYLSAKEKVKKFEPSEELIFFPELYGICPRSRHSCLNLKKNSELRKRIELFIKRTTNPNKRTPFFRYIHEYNFVEIHLDYLNLKTKIPEQIFQCRNLRILSLNGNGLRTLSPNIGRLKKLQVLQLTDNYLETKSLPYSLTFCRNLHTLYLDNNKMIVLPGFLLEMKNLQTIRRLSTKFTLREVWITTKYYRIEEIKKLSQEILVDAVPSLVKLAAGNIIVSKLDYFSIDGLSTTLQNVISKYYNDFFICENCTQPSSGTASKSCRYEVNTYRYGHLGNYWTTFVHKACSRSCAEHLDEYSYSIEKRTEIEVSRKYYNYIRAFEEKNVLENHQSPITCCVIC